MPARRMHDGRDRPEAVGQRMTNSARQSRNGASQRADEQPLRTMPDCFHERIHRGKARVAVAGRTPRAI